MGAHGFNGRGSLPAAVLSVAALVARHLEYRHVWLKPHRVRAAFNWKPIR